VAICQDQNIQPGHLPDNIFPSDLMPRPGEQYIDGDTLEAYELEAIRKALAKCQGHRKNAARMLGIGEATLYRKLAKYELEAQEVV
jgi:two-component system response regulator HydG